MGEGRGTRWLDAEQQASWRALVVGVTLLFDRLDEDLQREFDLSLGEYEILVRLSERPGRQMRMAQLADALAHSRSRVTHTVARMENAGLVVRGPPRPRTAAGSSAAITDKGTPSWRRRHVHVQGVREYVVDLASPDDFRPGPGHGRGQRHLIACHPEADIRS